MPQHFDALLIDNDSNERKRYAQWLQEKDFLVAEASDGGQALRELEERCPNVLVMARELPDVEATEFCRWLRSQCLPQYVYVIVLRADTDEVKTSECLNAGADAVLVKSCDKNEFLSRLAVGRRVIDLEKQLNKLAKCDTLTGLPSQSTMSGIFEREWNRSLRYQLPLSCAMIDLDFFKRINDTYGHSVGDQVLRSIASVLRKGCRGNDVVSRYGGEEFCVLLPETDEEHALVWAERIRHDIAELSINHHDKTLRVTASIGIAGRLDDTESSSQLIDLADQGLLIAKQTGRDRVVSFRAINKSDNVYNVATHGPGTVSCGIRAKDVMTTIIAGLNQDDNVWSAVQFFLRFRISSAPVIDSRGKLVGILSENDLMSIMIWPDWWSTKTHDVMKTNVVCYDEVAPVLAIYEFLCRVAIRSVVIVNEGQPTGVVSRSSLLRWFSNAKITKDRVMGEQTERADGDHDEDPHERLSATARDLVRQARIMEQHLTQDEVDFVPCVVGGASRIQELSNDLLALAGAANRRNVPIGWDESNVAHADESAAVEASEHIGSLANLIRKDDPPQAGLPAEFFQQLNPPNTSKV